MSLQDEYNFCQSGQWAETNPSKCPCRNLGWMLSDLDTWHCCPIHGNGVPEPHDDDHLDTFNYAAHKLSNMRAALLTFQRIAQNFGLTPRKFKASVMARVARERGPVTPATWVNAAEDVCEGADAYAGHPWSDPDFSGELEEHIRRQKETSCDLNGRDPEYADYQEPDAERIALDRAYERDTYYGSFNEGI